MSFLSQDNDPLDENIDVRGFFEYQHARERGEWNDVASPRKPSIQILPDFLNIQSLLRGWNTHNHIFPSYKRWSPYLGIRSLPPIVDGDIQSNLQTDQEKVAKISLISELGRM